MRTPITHKIKKLILPILLVVLLVVGGYFAYAYYSKDLWPFKSTAPAASYEQDETTDGSTRTIEDEADSQDAKKDIIEKEDNPTTPSNTISVLITSTRVLEDALEVRGFSDSIIESGTCTLSATMGSSVQTTTSPAFIDASSTICEPLQIDKSKLASGEWDIKVTIKTASSEGVSETVKVNI